VKGHEEVYRQTDCIYYGFDVFYNFGGCYDCVYFFRKVVV